MKTLPNLIELKIDIQNQEQSLSVLTMLPKLLMLNGTSTKAEVPCAVIDLDDAETTEISLDNDKLTNHRLLFKFKFLGPCYLVT